MDYFSQKKPLWSKVLSWTRLGYGWASSLRRPGLGLTNHGWTMVGLWFS